MGVFQIESPAIARACLRTMKARTLEEVAQALALIRPGAAEYGSKELFLRRLAQNRKKKSHFAHPELETILGDTLGVCIFQEQVMQIFTNAWKKCRWPKADPGAEGRPQKFSGRSGSRSVCAGKFLKAAGTMGLTSQQTRKKTWMMVEKIRGLWFFAKRTPATICGHLVPHGVSEKRTTRRNFSRQCAARARGSNHVSAYVEEAKTLGYRGAACHR